MRIVGTILISALALFSASDLHAQGSRTIPAQFHGTWTWSKDGVHPSDGEQPLTITSGEIAAHETSGRVARIARISADGRTCVIDVDAACEGMEGRETLTLILSPDGRRLTLKQENANTCGFGAGNYYRAR